MQQVNLSTPPTGLIYNPSTSFLIWGEGGGAPPPAPRIRNGGHQIKRMIGAPGTQLKKKRNAFLRHWGSWTSSN